MRPIAALLLVAFLGGVIAHASRPKPPPVTRFVPADVRFCKDWRDRQMTLCDRIPLRREVAI